MLTSHFDAKRKVPAISFLLAAGVGFFIVYGYQYKKKIAGDMPLVNPLRAEKISSGPTVRIGQNIIAVELATTTEAWQKGLSGRASLDPDNGMLFLFPKPDVYRFWMPDMHFPLDIIWISEDNRIVDIDENVSHGFDPMNPVFFTPRSRVKYVLEVNAGFAKRGGIRIGETAIFNLKE
jgi:uncharacterized membrane protein (UPF0127 family)